MCDKAVLAGGYISGEQTGRAMEDAILTLCGQVSHVTFVGNPLCPYCAASTVTLRLSNQALPSPKRYMKEKTKRMHFTKVLGHLHSRLLCRA